MRRFIALVATLLVSLPFTFSQPADLTQRLTAHVEFLTSPTLEGRKAGSSGGRMAAEYISNEFDALGLKPFERADFFHPFTATFQDGVFQNVVARIDGTDKDKYIIIGAHYDHLGIQKEELYPGANDNASGTAALIELARLFTMMNYKPTHTLIFAAFDAEEIGLFGSEDLAQRFNKRDVRVMVNMDMIGMLQGGTLTIEGVGTLNGAEGIIDNVAAKNNLQVKKKRFETSLLTATDTKSFAEKNIPTLSLTTGSDSAYHEPEDTASRIDYKGLADITLALADLVVELDHTQEVASSGKVARKHNSGNNALRLGVAYGWGSNYHSYPGAAIRGKEAAAWNFGLSALYAHKYFGFRTGLSYEHRKALTPADTNNPFGAARTITTGAVTIPAELMIKTKGATCIYLAGGGYYSLNILGKQDGGIYGLAQLGLNAREYGLQWSFGVSIANFFIEANNRYALTPVYVTGPAIHNRTNYCTVGLYF